MNRDGLAGIRLRFFLVAPLFAAVALFSTGCRKAAPSDATLVAAIPASPLTLDPRLASDAEGDKISSIICDGLVARTGRLELAPALAERVERLSELSWRFHLREGVLFHDGSPLTAADVVYTYESIRGGKIASPHKGAYEWIKEVVAEDPLTVRFDLASPYGPFLSRLTRGIVSKAAAEKAGEAFGRMPVCTGPYRVERFVPESSGELVANDGYFGEKPMTRRLHFRVIKDDNVRVLKLMKGDIDLVQNAVPPMLMGALLKNPELSIESDVGIVMAYMGMNLTDPILKDPKVREAIALTIDRDAIISHRFKGLAVKANSILSPDNWAYAENLPQGEYDPARARALLDEAGYPDPDGEGGKPRFTLTFKTSTVKERVDTARMIAEQLRAVGIAARVAPYEWATFFRDIRRGNFQIYTLSWVGVTEPDIFYEVCHSAQLPPGGLNRGRYANARIDELVAEGRFTMDEERRRELYGEVQRILLRDLPFIPLWYEKNSIVYRKELTGVAPRPDASYRAFVEIGKRP